MKASRTTTWARLRVSFATLLLGLFALGGLLTYASSRVDPNTGHGRSDLRSLGLEIMVVVVIAGALAFALENRLSRDT